MISERELMEMEGRARQYGSSPVAQDVSRLIRVVREQQNEITCLSGMNSHMRAILVPPPKGEQKPADVKPLKAFFSQFKLK